MRHVRWTRTRRVLEDGPLLTTIVVIATLAFHAFYLLPATRGIAATLMHEDNVVEDVTFVALAIACGMGVTLAMRTQRAGAPLLTWGFFALLAVGLFVVAMEEISWGQWLFFFKTPDTWRHLNQQGETNLHNLPGLFGRSEWLRLTFAVGGLVGVLANRRPALRAIATPTALTGTFAFVTAYVLLDFVDDVFTGVPWVFTTFSVMSEWVEMLIGLSAVAYFVLKQDLAKRSGVVEPAARVPVTPSA